MVAQAATAAARVESTGGTRLKSFLLAAASARAMVRRRVRGAPAPDAPIDPGCIQLVYVARLYRLVLQRLPDPHGLRHHAALLAAGSTLPELASSLLAASSSACGSREDAARVMWARAGGGGTGFEAAWRAASGLPDFAAALVRHPIRRDATLLPALFPDGVDPELADVGPAWAYRLWAGEIDEELDRLARRARPLLRLFGSRITLTLALDPDTQVAALDASLGGLSRQIYGRWRLHLHGTAPAGWSPPADPRIVWRTGDGSAPEAVLSRPVLRGALQPGDVPAPSCLALFALAGLRRPTVSRWSCDEDRINGDGMRVHPRLHRDGGLVLLRGQSDRVRTVDRHLPAVLLHRDAGRSMAAEQAFSDMTLPTASLVIVTRDRPALLQRCLHSIRATTGAAGTPGGPEIVIVDNGTEDLQALLLLRRCLDEGCTVLRRPGAFNWSALCNAGVRASTGAVAVLINNDVECIGADWLPVLLAACDDPAVGVVGARLLYGDGRVQHNGVLVGPGAVAAHRLDGADVSVAATRTVSAVTGACMAFRRTVFERLGGLEEELPVTWNDLDFCMRAREIGLEVRVATGCVLRHDELGTRTPDTAPENRVQLEQTRTFVSKRHRRVLRRDRFLHPFLLFASSATNLDPSAPNRIGRLLAKGGID